MIMFGSSMGYRAPPVLLLVVTLIIFRIAEGDHQEFINYGEVDGLGFVKRSGTHFSVDGQLLFPNGFNAYWLMREGRSKASAALRQASGYGMNVVRTMAFSDGQGDAQTTLQSSPGVYNEHVFQDLDFVISEAKKHGVYLILSLVNNFEDLGGKRQYVEWARDRGEQLASDDDDFFTNDLVKRFYKHHVKTILTRNNTITGVTYRDDPTVFAWELMNEPRCQTDLSGQTLQAWITEMAAYVKSIDGNHLLEVGLEGFYGGDRSASSSDGDRDQVGYTNVGTDFISNNQVPGIDFATIHAYPDSWLPAGSDEEMQLGFLRSWIHSHTRDAGEVLGMPLLITEFGKSSRLSETYTVAQRDALYRTVYSAIYRSVATGGPCAGGLFWQLLLEGMDSLRDGYEVILSEYPSTARIIARQSFRISSLAANLNILTS